MKKLANLFSRSLAIILAAMSFTATDAAENPTARKEAVVTHGNARFTVLTPQLIRMEWSDDGSFEDRKTLTVVNRDLDVPRFNVSRSGKKLTLKTDRVTLTYKDNGQPFDGSNLKATFDVNGKKTEWTPASESNGNLLGTTRTLDGCDGTNCKFEPGLISRDGWTVVDDTRRHVLKPDSSEWGEWVEVAREGNRQDLYLFAHGHDYKQALADYQKIAGRAPLPPKYTFGYWWSRYWQYSDDELVDLVGKMKSMGIPIDVLIVDMDWHDTWADIASKTPKDEYGQRVGWTGYTWQKELFPHPANFLKWTDNENLKVALNLHPASGIQPYEECYGRFVKEYGQADTTRSVPFKIDEKKWADAYFKTVLEPMEQIGVDFWWLDWQQWKESKYTPGLSNTFWLNHTFFKHASNRDSRERPFIYHRWGGLGSHRYPLGFSGDTHIKWSTLAFLPYFTSTASNVNYGYWGHDIGGHYFKNDGTPHVTDPELYLRWLQYGVFTPIFKTHSTKDMNIVRYMWAFPDHMFRMRDAMKLRYALVPYIYNAARENYDTGVAMSRPMYYEYPESSEAYDFRQQFFFGNDIIATAVTEPVDSVTGLADRTMWFPEGKWYDYATGEMIDGGRTVTLQYTLDENPFYVKAGAILPMNADNVVSLQQPSDTLVLTFIPGGDGELRHYEDDGISRDYDNNHATTVVSKTTSGNKVKVRIAAREGKYEGAPDRRGYQLRFPAMLPPSSVTVNGENAVYSRFPENGQWGYDARSLQPVVYIGPSDVDRDLEIVLDYEGVEGDPASVYGRKGLFNRCRVLTPDFKIEQALHGGGHLLDPTEYLKVSQCASAIMEDPASASRHLAECDDNLNRLPSVIDSMKIIGDDFKTRLKKQITDQFNRQ